ncbi:MAG: prolyl oligopeptidase family serine peptidase [Verrucomicrobiaceae bacterium]|nr:prolyl oligopeptidase family serine peptidase [Verrucomicrobiaceae bacterium]
MSLSAIAQNWPSQVVQVGIPASDGATQQAMWFAPDVAEKKPLLVGLHTWSSDFKSAGGDAVYAEWAISQGWAFVHPDFRGPNWTPAALGSDRAVQDVVEAVAWAKKQTAVDDARIYLIGVSGGGHMAMQMAGRHPEIWAGVSAWCGIGDVGRWFHEHTKAGKSDRYAQNIIAALGKAPAMDDAEAWRRSPESCLAKAATVPLDIAHGIHDGRIGSVPFEHSLRAFNAVAQPALRLDAGSIASYYATQTRPAEWAAPAPEAVYGLKTPLFRAMSGHARVTIFEGGHEIVHQAALNWLAKQRKGQPAIWEVKEFIPIGTERSASGK